MSLLWYLSDIFIRVRERTWFIPFSIFKFGNYWLEVIYKRKVEKAMTAYSSTLAWKIPWMEEPGRLQSTGSRRVGHDWANSLSLSCIGEGNGNPLQCSCLENPRDGGASRAANYGVAESQTRLKWFSSSSSIKERGGSGNQIHFLWCFRFCDSHLTSS